MPRHLLPGNVQGEYNTRDETTTSEARYLLRHAYGDDTGYIAVFSGVRVEGDKCLRYTRERFFKYPEELTAAIGHAEDRAREYGREVYFCTHLLTEERRKKEYAAPITCLYAEIDGEELHEVAERYATAIVESSPGRYHVYIRLTHAITPEEAAYLNKRFARTVGGDPSGADLTQLLRVPGTPNNKYADKPTVRVKRLLPDAAYDPDTLEQVFDTLPRNDTPTPIREARTPINLEDEELLEKARNARGGAGERFCRLYYQGDLSDHDNDHSRADHALMRMLAFWTAWDQERMEYLFDASALGRREKWRRRADYRRLTVDKAIADQPRAYQQPAGVDSALADAVTALRAQGGSLAWEGRSGPTDCHAYDALVEHAATYGTRKEKSVVVSMDVRTLALAAGVGRLTAQKALERLQTDRKLIRCIRKGKGAQSSVYALKLPAQGYATKHCVVSGIPLRSLRNPTPQTEKEYDKNGRKINHSQQYLLGRIGKGAALVLERVLAAGESGVTLRDVARSLDRRPRDIRRRTVRKLLEANLITCEGDEELLRVVEDFDYLLSQELLESGCIAAEARDRKRYAEDRRARRAGITPDAAPTEGEMQAERDAQVEQALHAFADERSGPGLTFLNYRDGNTKTFDYLVNAVAYYYNSPPYLWRHPVEQAYEIAVNGADA